MTISKDFLYYYGDCFRGFLKIGWQNYFNIMIFLLKYTYILICMWRNVRFNFFDFCLGSTAMWTKIKFRIYSNFWFSYYFLRHTLSIYTNYCKVQRCKWSIYAYICVHSIKIKVWVHFLAKITLTISWNIIACLMMFEF